MRLSTTGLLELAGQQRNFVSLIGTGRFLVGSVWLSLTHLYASWS